MRKQNGKEPAAQMPKKKGKEGGFGFPKTAANPME